MKTNFTLGVYALSVAMLVSCGDGSRASAENKAQLPDTTIAVEMQAGVQEGKVSPLRFAFAGDIMMGTTYPETPKGAYLPANDGKDLLRDVADIFRNAHVAAANLEGVMMEPGTKAHEDAPPEICFSFRMPPKYVQNLVDVGMDFMSVANNHVNDFWEAGVDATHANLRKAGIAFAGYRGKCEKAVIERGGYKIGFAAFGHTKGTLSIMDYDEVRRVVGELRRDCHIVVVSFHGGGEGVKYAHVPHAEETFYNGQRRGNVEKFAHTAVDAGADIVYGHGPHVPRAMEVYRNRLIMYSLGNFCTPYRLSLGGACGFAPLVEVEVDSVGQFLRGRIHSLIQHKGVGPRSDSTHKAAQEIRRLSEIDFPKTSPEISADGQILPRKP